MKNEVVKATIRLDDQDIIGAGHTYVEQRCPYDGT